MDSLAYIDPSPSADSSSNDDFDLLFAQLDSASFDPSVFDLASNTTTSFDDNNLFDEFLSSKSNSPTNTESSSSVISDYNCVSTREVFQQKQPVVEEEECLNLDLAAFNEFIEKTKSSLVSPVSICVPTTIQDKNGVTRASEIILNFEPTTANQKYTNDDQIEEEAILLNMLNSGDFDDIKPLENIARIESETRIELNDENDEDMDDDDDDESSQDSLKITDAKKILTDEEKSVYKKEGHKIPTRLPLTKSEEKLLKLVKRKIRNKKSAHVSRERKKKYVDGLEKRVDLCTRENEELLKTVQLLKTQNSQLMSKMQSMQSCLSLLLNKHKKSSTAVLFVSFLITFCIYPYVDDTNTMQTVLSDSAPLNYRNSMSRALFSLNFSSSGGGDSSQSQQDVVWNYYKARFDI